MKRLLFYFLMVAVVVGGYLLISAKSSYSISSSQAPLPTAIDPNFSRQVNECFLPAAAVYGYNLYVTSGFRSMTDQAAIYSEGRTASGTVITEAPPGHSLHNYGYAVDVADEQKGYDINWQRLIAIGTWCSLENGGDGDYPHFEYRGGLTTNDFAAGKRPPPLTLPCTVMDERAKANQAFTLQDLRSCGAPRF